MIHANAVASQPRFAKNDQALTRGDHFLHVMQIEPAADERLAERIRIRLVPWRFENLFPAATPAQRSLDHLAAQTDRRVAFLARKFRKLLPIFVPSRIMREQIFHCLEAEPAQREQARARDPIEFSQRLRDFHHLGERSPRRPGCSASPRRTFFFVNAITQLARLVAALPPAFQARSRLRIRPLEYERQCPMAATAELRLLR